MVFIYAFVHVHAAFARIEDPKPNLRPPMGVLSIERHLHLNLSIREIFQPTRSLQANSDIDAVKAATAPSAVAVAQRHISIGSVEVFLILSVSTTIASGPVVILGGSTLVVVVATTRCMVCNRIGRCRSMVRE
jgi:hypothetical protein